MKRFLAALFFILAAARGMQAAVTITAHSLTAGGNSADLSSYSTASVSPVSNEVTIVILRNSKAAAPATACTVSGNGITWTQIATRTYSGLGVQRITAWWGSSASPSSGAITFSCGGLTQAGASWSVVGFPNADPTAPIVQFVTNTAFASGVTATLAGFSSTDNVTFGAFHYAFTGGINPGSGFTEVNEDTTDGSMETEFFAGQDTTVNATSVSGTNHDWGVIAIELKPGASAPPPAATAISVNPLNHGLTDSNHSSDTTNSFTPVANEPILVAVSSSTSVVQVLTPTISGCGITWNQERTRLFAGSPTTISVTLWSGMTANPSSCSLTITYGQTVLRSAWKVNGFTGADPTSPVVQSADNAGFAQALTITLSAFGNVNNATYGVFRWNFNSAVTPGSGFTEISEDTGSAYALQDEFRSDNDTSVDATFAGGANKDVGGIACELRIGTAVTVSPLLTLLLEEQ